MSGRPVRRTVLKEIDEDMRFVRQIGAGDQGVAKLFQRTRDGRLFVRKSYHENTPGRLPHEGFILSSAIAPHPRILKIVGFQRASGSGANLFFQYCEGGNLKDFAREYGRGLPEPFVWHIFVQMAEALALIREFNSVHLFSAGPALVLVVS